MSNATFVLMNCDLVAVPLQLERGGVVTVYCGARRAMDLSSARGVEPSIGLRSSPSRAVAAPAQKDQVPRTLLAELIPGT